MKTICRLPRFAAKWILRINPPDWILVMCRGYEGDDENFTELCWPDDCDLDFDDNVWYPEFQLWINPYLMWQRIKNVFR